MRVAFRSAKERSKDRPRSRQNINRLIARLAGRNCVVAAPWGGLQDFRRGAKAFTLLELMIVLVILTIFMSIAWPRITGQIQLVAPREAALQLKSDLSEAREQAVISGEPWALRIRRGKPDYEIGPVSEFKKQQNSLSLTAPLAGVEAILQQQPTQQPGTTTSSLNVSSHNESPVNESSSTGQLSNPPTSMSVPTERSLVESLELPDGMVFDDGFAHSTQDVNQLRFPGSQQGTNPTPLTPTLPESQTLPPTSTQSAVLGTNPVVTQPAVSNNNWKYVVIFQPDGRATGIGDPFERHRFGSQNSFADSWLHRRRDNRRR